MLLYILIELELGSKSVIEMNDPQTTLLGCAGSAPRTFAFDNSLDSTDSNNPNYRDQAYVFEALGAPLVRSALDGYNACILAYGQTGLFLLFA